MKVGTIKKAVAALVVATAATAGISGAAFATKNDHRYQHSAEAHSFVFSCDDLWNGFEKAVNDAHKADRAGQTKVRDQALLAADGILDSAKQQGCSWVSA